MKDIRKFIKKYVERIRFDLKLDMKMYLELTKRIREHAASALNAELVKWEGYHRKLLSLEREKAFRELKLKELKSLKENLKKQLVKLRGLEWVL